MSDATTGQTPTPVEDDEVQENDGSNAVATDDPDFIGVNEEYKNYGLDVLQPHSAPSDSPDAALEQRAKDYAENMKVGNVGRHGFSTEDIPHPSKAKQPASAHIEKNRTAMDRATR